MLVNKMPILVNSEYQRGLSFTLELCIPLCGLGFVEQRINEPIYPSVWVTSVYVTGQWHTELTFDLRVAIQLYPDSKDPRLDID